MSAGGRDDGGGRRRLPGRRVGMVVVCRGGAEHFEEVTLEVVVARVVQGLEQEPELVHGRRHRVRVDVERRLGGQRGERGRHVRRLCEELVFEGSVFEFGF